ncbi:D-Ala-D-Ala carboxypeptidase family metallohydrolase [Micromonospora sp. WMMA1363]|uniref:D-Ala-D-Ala carboxypeptidase family metallohydrolase n=1 Tax=Micromonospora sp. WMMA1363 TaxID=3053985 RepID=UPI00259C7582|nr:D-Ala-D-Ala carboxypeptidase family metallohydrolase [Micromonospora sp. WMMA1363]MDM4723440.1 D-Ala-D-Ala carboxypeptidase family metallohydrolase [Micromonospora sp. WMMA1363]MDM4723596.1 D-Ala-D-Ala carboxypeptidase family metallohydrolase [Micromonospora sp. WMMA1363]
MYFYALKRMVVAFVLALPGTAVATVVAAPAAHADGCYTWTRTLKQGRSGNDVRQLQIRVAGWAAYRNIVHIDGIYGPETAAAVRRFQSAYGLRVDGIAGPQTFAKIYSLQDDDCTPQHFSYSELDNGCGKGGWSGGPLSASATREAAVRTMWKLEALRRSLGDKPLYVTSGFRDIACNRQVGGVSNSQHLYGKAADLQSRTSSLCEVAREARNHGFSGILGPGYPNHNDHVHVDSRRENNSDNRPNTTDWSAPACGVG